MHAEHAEPQRIIGRKGAQAHERGRDRDVARPGEPGQVLGCARGDNASPGVDKRLPEVLEQLDDLAQLLHVGFHVGLVAAHLDLLGLGENELGQLLLDVLGHVYQDRARPPGPGEIERPADGQGQIVDAFHQIVVLGARPGDSHDIDFLECVVADERRGDLTGDDHHRNRVHVGRGDAGDRVRGARPGGGQAHADLASGSGVAVGGMNRALLVAHQDMLDGVVGYLIVDVDDGSARKAENDLHTLTFQTLEKDLSSIELHGIMPPLFCTAPEAVAALSCPQASSSSTP